MLRLCTRMYVQCTVHICTYDTLSPFSANLLVSDTRTLGIRCIGQYLFDVKSIDKLSKLLVYNIIKLILEKM